MHPVIRSGARNHAIRETAHRGDDDLLTAGLGAEGLRAALAPAFVDAAAPTAAEQRRRAIWSNWRGIADLSAHGGYGRDYGSLARVPGREYHSLLRLPGARQPHRVMLQLPDQFDADARCLLVTASSGSRGVYGAIAVASAWGLPRGCAVVHTDKGGGCDWVDGASGLGFALDGTATDDPAELAFAPLLEVGVPRVAVQHAHSGDNPEAEWGRHVRQAAEFGLAMLDRALPQLAPFTPDNTRIIAVGLSNGGAAVLRAAEETEPFLSGVVAAAPNIHPGVGGRPLFDYASEAALWMGAAQGAARLADAPLPAPLFDPGALLASREAAGAGLVAHGLLAGIEAGMPAEAAYLHLRGAGWTDAALQAASLSTVFDMWRAVGVVYSSAYGRFGVDAHPTGCSFALLDAGRRPRAPTASERAVWWSEGAGVVPGLGVEIIDPAADPWAGLQRLRALWTGSDELARRVQQGIAATRAALPRADLPILLLHGIDDGLIPEAFSSAPYAAWCQGAGRRLSYWRLQRVQHFDCFLALPAFAERYVALLPHTYAALDAMWAHLFHGSELPGDREIAPAAAAAAVVDEPGVALPAAAGEVCPAAH
jgi:hydroxybutyrate-dimer hydrolase